MKNSFFAPIRHIYYIYKTSYTNPCLRQKRLMVKVLSTLLCLPGSKPRHRTTKEARHSKKEKYTRAERGTGGRVREPQRLGMSQGTMIREPKYGGGAHPKYGSCRVLVSQIPITEVWSGCPHEVPKLTDKAFLRTVTFSHHRHMVHLVWFLGTLS